MGRAQQRGASACRPRRSIPAVRARFLGGLFLICMCGLMLQNVETRILSVISYYYLAFSAISMATFGMTAGSLFAHGIKAAKTV
jgi:hypothetical protein